MTLNGNSDETNGYNSVIKDGSVANANFVKSVIPPIGSIISWAKTFDKDGYNNSGTTTATTADKLVDTGGTPDFDTTVAVGDCIHNTTDDTFAYVTAVDSVSALSIDADIMASGETYDIYKTPALPDGWVECDGTQLSDSDSPFHLATLPDLNSTQSFPRGSITSGSTGGEDTHTLITSEMPAHTHTTAFYGNNSTGTSYIIGSTTNTGGAGAQGSSSTGGDGAHNNLPVYYEVVFIMRVK